MQLSQEDIEKLFQKKPGKEPERPSVDVGLKIKKSKDIQSSELKIKKVKRQIKKFGKEKKKDKKNLEFILKFAFWTGLLGFLFFVLMSYQSYFIEAKWVYFTNYLDQSFPTTKTNPISSPTPTPTATSTPLSAIALPTDLPQTSTADGNFIKIDKIGVDAPIIWNVEESNIIDNLKNGVVHYNGTSLPGEGGNVFVTGHSSNYFWIKSDYNSVFALLGKLEKGDRITIRKGSKWYFYTVTESKVVSPEDVSVLKNTNKEVLTLMTCWPVGTSLNRLIVQSELLYISS